MKHCPLCEQQFSDEHTTCPHDGMQLVVSYEWAAQSLIRGKYRILGKLGQGGMGIVYKAQHILMGEPRALKVMSPELARDASFLRRFRQEAQSASRLKHPNIVQVNDLDQAEDGSLFMAMEFVDGVSLRQLLTDAHGPLPLARALAIARGMAEALGAAHAAGLVHRDIKPENVLVARDAQGRDVAKILDFGIVAMRESSAQLSSAVIQTDAYASPEQWMGMKSDAIDGRADLYSLGMTLFEMLTGRLPFESYNRLGWMRAHLDLQPPPPSGFNPALPPSVDELVLRLLAKNRDERTPSAEAFIEELKRVEAGMAYAAPTVLPKVPSRAEGPKTPPPSPREVSRPTPPRTPTPPRDVAVKTPPRQPESFPLTEPPITLVEPVEPHITIPPVRSLAKEQKRAPKAQTRWILWAGVAIVVVMVAGVAFYVWWPSGREHVQPESGTNANQVGQAKPGPKPGEARENFKDGLKYVWIPPGRFQMGCSLGDNECDSHEKPIHPVTLSRGFWIAQTETTVGAYRRFVSSSGGQMPTAPSFNSGWRNEAMPIVLVSWDDAQAYCGWVGGRLPTEAEWEYAARGGSTEGRYAALDDIAWYDKNSGGQTHDVAQKRANGFGLFDTLGNVWEWVNDWYDPSYYQKSPATDPAGPSSGQQRVLRGRSWFFSNAGNVRVSVRGRIEPGNRILDIGFRCLREVASP